MIIKYDDSYEKQVNNLLNNYSMNWSSNAIERILYLEGEFLIGIGSLSKNKVHPNREYINIYVHPDKRRRGIGTNIFKELLAQSKLKKFQAAFSSKDTMAVSFTSKCGFNIARKCFTPLLNSEKFSISLNNKIEFKPFNELSFNQKEKLFNLQLENYQVSHQHINPLSESITSDSRREIISEGLSQKYTYVLLNKGAIEAYLISYENDNDDNDDTIEIGYVGGKDTCRIEEYLVFYKQVYNRLVNEFNNIEIEADDVDPYAYALVNEFEYDKNDSWDTYVFDGK